ncbi:MAG: hypothetical protein WA192_09570 [Candidatus Acidiferrales bacterium]
MDIQEGAVFDLAWQVKPGGAGNVDLIRVADDAAPQTTADDTTRRESPSPAQKVVPRTVAPVPAPAAADPGLHLFQNAQQAFSQGRYFVPLNGSALHWAIQSRNAGNQNGRALETEIDGIYRAQAFQLYQQRNFPAALRLVNTMLAYYPGEPGLLRDQQQIIAASRDVGPNPAPFNVLVPQPQCPSRNAAQHPPPPRP